MLFALVLITACLSFKIKINRHFVFMIYGIMTLMLCLRYGQGTDYFGYRDIYNIMRNWNNFRAVHGEQLYLFLCHIFNYIGNFEFFAATAGLFNMYMLYGFIKNNSPNFSLSFLLCLPVIYLGYFYSLLRQGIVLAVFLRYCTDFIKRKEWKEYIASCLILSLIHSVAMIYIIVPFVLKLSLKSIILCIPCSLIVGMSFLRTLIPFLGDWDASFIAAAERALSLLVIIVIYYSLHIEDRNKYEWFIKLYCIGTALYFLFISASTAASRIAVCFKALEIVLVPCLIQNKSRYRQLCIVYFLITPVLLYAYNANGYAQSWQSRGGSRFNWISYPYISVFNKEDIWNIYNYRD